MKQGKRILLLGAYSMEVIECGGALLKNVLNGGISHAVIAFAGGTMKEELKRSADILKTSVEFLNWDVGKITASYEEKLEMIKVIRSFRPDIVITQDTEHHITDLDPGRRPFMTLVLEALALAGRPYALDAIPGLEPSHPSAVYYMTPEHPNCVIDLFDVWEQKCAAMDELHAQNVHFGKRENESERDLKIRKSLVPEWETLETDLERGTLMKRKMDDAFYRAAGAAGHCRAVYAEPYRREGCFIFDELPE